jgi:hypothetical protein
MSALPEGTRGRVLAVSIAVLMLCVVFAVVVMPLLNVYAASAQALDDRRALLGRYERAAADLPKLRASSQGTRPDGVLLLTGATDALAAADLQSTLKDLVEGGGATLDSAQTLPPETLGNFRRVGVRVSFSGGLELLTTVLLGVEAAKPVLSVGSLEVNSSDEETGEDLAIAMDVHGYRLQ